MLEFHHPQAPKKTYFDRVYSEPAAVNILPLRAVSDLAAAAIAGEERSSSLIRTGNCKDETSTSEADGGRGDLIASSIEVGEEDI